eukprot:m.93582 g.93582  ORF g.93582 m.93582 type:complete len:334 (+) comp16532_c0_seq20:331-1332(+)
MPRQSGAEQRMRERLAQHKREKEVGASYSAKAASVSGHAPIGMERSGNKGNQPDRSRSALGFEYTALLAGRQAEYIRSSLKYFAHRSARWKAAFPIVIPYQGGAVNTLLNLRKSAKLKRFCRKGIPTDLRPSVWMSISGASKRMHSSPGVYQKLVDKGSPEFSQQILLDMHRTFPNNCHFRPDGCVRQQQLHRLLSAYATFNPGVGYCQGMNFVCGMLLLVLNGNEEETFWLFDAMLAKMPPNMYAADMLGIQAECATFFSIMKEDYPDLSATLARRGALEVVLCRRELVVLGEGIHWLLCAPFVGLCETWSPGKVVLQCLPVRLGTRCVVSR